MKKIIKASILAITLANAPQLSGAAQAPERQKSFIFVTDFPGKTKSVRMVVSDWGMDLWKGLKGANVKKPLWFSKNTTGVHMAETSPGMWQFIKTGNKALNVFPLKEGNFPLNLTVSVEGEQEEISVIRVSGPHGRIKREKETVSRSWRFVPPTAFQYIDRSGCPAKQIDIAQLNSPDTVLHFVVDKDNPLETSEWDIVIETAKVQKALEQKKQGSEQKEEAAGEMPKAPGGPRPASPKK